MILLLHLSQHTSRIDVLFSDGGLKSCELSNVFHAYLFTCYFEEHFHQEKNCFLVRFLRINSSL